MLVPHTGIQVIAVGVGGRCVCGGRSGVGCACGGTGLGLDVPAQVVLLILRPSLAYITHILRFL